jgi:hypothetical protein
VSENDSYGMRSTNLDMSGKLKFSLEDNEVRTGYLTIGFILRNYKGGANAGNVTGKGGQSMHFYLTFEKK